MFFRISKVFTGASGGKAASGFMSVFGRAEFWFDEGVARMGASDRRRTGETVIAVQLDGKVRGAVRIPGDAPVEAVRARVAHDRTLGRFLAGRSIIKEFYIPGRVYSLVTSP